MLSTQYKTIIQNLALSKLDFLKIMHSREKQNKMCHALRPYSI
jgi:hypothetical protein